jgi:hypothetical protein
MSKYLLHRQIKRQKYIHELDHKLIFRNSKMRKNVPQMFGKVVELS